MNELSECSSRGLRPPTRQTGKAGEHRVCLLDANVRHLAAVASVPAQRRSPEPPGIVDQEKDELERVGQASPEIPRLACQRRRLRVRVPSLPSLEVPARDSVV